LINPSQYEEKIANLETETSNLNTQISTLQLEKSNLEFLYYHTRPQLRTYIWRKATSLSYDDFLKHLSFLKEKGLAKENGLCRITEKGRKVYDELRNALPSIL